MLRTNRPTCFWTPGLQDSRTPGPLDPWTPGPRSGVKCPMRTLGIVALLLLAGCASAPIKKADQASLAVAQTRVLEGCYQCLLEARDVFERVAVGKARPLVVARLFETYVLIGMRERELALDSRESFAKARALVSELPVTYAGAQYVEIAELMPPDFLGTPRTEMSAFQRGAPPVARAGVPRTGPRSAGRPTSTRSGPGRAGGPRGPPRRDPRDSATENRPPARLRPCGQG